MKESVRIVRFAIVGTLNAIITALVVWLLMHVEGEDYLTANIAAYVIAQIHNFIWCKYWKWNYKRNRFRQNVTRITKFYITKSINT